MLTVVEQALVLVAAGTVAGTAGAAGAIASLISYPVLLAVGLPAIPANIANSVAAVAIGLGSAPASRPELRGSGRRLLRWLVIAAVGAAAGAALLLVTPARAFEWVVPFLVAAGSIVLIFRPRLSDGRQSGLGEQPGWLFRGGLFAVAAYNGYFGAGSGIMMLALLLATVDENLPRANALKNVLLLAGEVVVAVGFILFGSVQWAAVVPLGIGFFIGGALGPSIARRVPADRLRFWIALAGIGLAGSLLVVAIHG